MQKEKKRLFSASENMKQEYCAEIVRIGEMKPIEGSDFLVQTMVDGFSIVVSKGEFTEGEPVIYCMNETALNKDFLSVNNQFEIGERDLNANAAEVNAIMNEYNEKYKRYQEFFHRSHNYRFFLLLNTTIPVVISPSGKMTIRTIVMSVTALAVTLVLSTL
jgi:hypothetical protein